MESIAPSAIIRAGDRDGLGAVYSEAGRLICRPAETVLREADGWDMNVRSPWRRVLPRKIFSGFSGDVVSKLYVTTDRLVLIRQIDVWRELRGELSPLGIPTAAAKEVELRRLKSSGVRQYCEIWPRFTRVVSSKLHRKVASWLGLRLLGTDGTQYALTIWKAKGTDDETLSMVESRFPK